MIRIPKNFNGIAGAQQCPFKFACIPACQILLALLFIRQVEKDSFGFTEFCDQVKMLHSIGMHSIIHNSIDAMFRKYSSFYHFSPISEELKPIN